MPDSKKPIDPRPSRPADTEEAPLEDQPSEWSEENVIIEGRKPDLSEIEDDTSES